MPTESAALKAVAGISDDMRKLREEGRDLDVHVFQNAGGPKVDYCVCFNALVF